jgi:hypothetical protein
MRRKIVKSAISILLSATVLSVAITTFSGCEQVSDFIPEAYGEWDGNYVYRENYRSKTTGEDGEVLVSEVVDEGVTYEIKYCYDFYYYGDLIYLALRGETKNEDESLSKRNFFVRYNAKEKTQETVISSSVEESLDWISYVNDERIVLEKGDSYYAIDLNGNPIEEEFPSATQKTSVVNGEYLIYKNENREIALCSFADPTEYVMMDDFIWNSNDLEYDLVEEDGREGILISHYKDYNYLASLWFFDLDTKTLHTIDENINQYVVKINNKYFITFEKNTIEYTKKTGSCSHGEYRREVRNNCTLYSLDCANFTSKEICKFEPERDCATVFVSNDGDIIITQTWYENYVFMKNNGGERNEYYLLDTQTETLEKISSKSAYSDGFVHSKKVTCGAYEYYVASKNISGIWRLCYVYSFMRRNGESVETMQFWSTEGVEKACIEMWEYERSADWLDDFIVLPY